MENISVVKVSLKEVMDCLKLVSSYLGGKREESAEGYDRVLALDSDSALVALLMEDAAILVAGHFGGSLIRWRYTRATLEFTVDSPTDAESLQSALVRVVSLQVLRRWLRIVGSDYADTVSESAAEAADSLSIYFKDSVPGEAAHTPKASPRPLPPI